MEIISTLGIHWSQILAQVINFAIIAGVLTYFVYNPVLKLLDTRRERIKASMDDVERIERDKVELEKLKQEVLSKADKQAGDILEKAKNEAEAVKKEILETARKEADALIAKGRTLIGAERKQVYEEVEQHLTAMVIKMTEKILSREFTPADQKRLIAELEKELPASVK